MKKQDITALLNQHENDAAKIALKKVQVEATLSEVNAQYKQICDIILALTYVNQQTPDDMPEVKPEVKE